MQSKVFSSSPFTTDKQDPLKRIIVDLWGEWQSGKTHTALTFPKPLAMISLDRGEEGVIQKFQEDGDYYDGEIGWRSFTYDPPVRKDNESDEGFGARCEKVAAELWPKIRAAIVWACSNKDVKTICVDTHTEMWEVLRLASFGKLSRVPELGYTEVNAEFKSLLRKMEFSGKHVVLTGRAKREYKETINKNTGKKQSEGTGRVIRDGFSRLDYSIPASFRMESFIEKVRDKKTGKVTRGEFTTTATLTRYRRLPELVGVQLTNPTFLDIATTLRPDVDAEEWL